VTDESLAVRHMKESSLMIEAAKKIALRNTLVVKMVKVGNNCLIEKVVMD
jgi:hypothetical protein